MNNQYQLITKKNTKTFYYSTLFFPKKIRNDVFLLYSFVRIIDNFVDKKIPDKKNFFLYKNELINQLKKEKKSKLKIVNDFGELIKKYNLEKEIIDYLNTQQKELSTKKYKTLTEFKKFTYGVAGTIGIMMAKILGLKKESFESAKNLGQALQIINNVRDIYEDWKIGKVYIPEELLKKYDLNQKNFLNKNNRKKLYLVINNLLDYAFKLEKKARKEFLNFNKNILFPIKTAADLYHKTGLKCYQNPELIFNQNKLKPNLLTVIYTLIKNFILIYGFNKKN